MIAREHAIDTYVCICT